MATPALRPATLASQQALTRYQRQEAIERLERGETQADIARTFGVSQATISAPAGGCDMLTHPAFSPLYDFCVFIGKAIGMEGKMLMVPNLLVVEPNNIFRKVPTRKPNADMRHPPQIRERDGRPSVDTP